MVQLLRLTAFIFSFAWPGLVKSEQMNQVSMDLNHEIDREILQTQNIIQQEFGLSQLRLKIDQSYLQLAIRDGALQVKLPQAVRLALQTVMSDFEEIESPLNIAASAWKFSPNDLSDVALAKAQEAVIKKYLKFMLNQASSKLSLYTGTEESGFPPEYGEDWRKNWIFFLQIPNLSDHLYWIIVDNTGKRPPYIYGKN